ncbi:O10C1 protein, partial [Crocuta crocuta]
TMSGNQSLCTKFTFVAFSSLAELQPVLFVVFLLVYLFTVGGNLVIISLISVTPSLHTPMYFFLVNLSFLEMCYITSVVPQMLVHLLMENKTISVGGCAAQMYIFAILGLTECCLLAAMAYDRFVAICYPLRYTLLMSPRVCLILAAVSWTTGVVGYLSSLLSPQMSGSEPTMSGNQSLCTKFTFVAFSSLAELQPVLFVVFLLVYLFTVGGNLVIISLISVTPSLHTPMYFFLVNLSFLEMCYITSVVPQMLVHLLVENKTISVGSCIAQMYIFAILGLTECCLLAAMAYDRFVAICYPLRYTLLMSPRVCLILAAASWATGVVVESAQITWIFSLPFCGTGKIQHFFCDIMPVVKLACVDTSHNEIVMFVLSILFIMTPCLLILCSYLRILVTILSIPSAAGRRKAFSTCSSHI